MFIITNENGEIVSHNEFCSKEDIKDLLQDEHYYWLEDMHKFPYYEGELKEHEFVKSFLKNWVITHEIHKEIPFVNDEELLKLEMQSNIDYLVCLAELYIQ